MIKHQLLIAWRMLFRHKISSLINISGFSIGITCCVLAALFIIDELSYDRQYKDSGNIYRIVTDVINDEGTRIPDASSPPSIPQAVRANIPEIKNITRIFVNAGNIFDVRTEQKQFFEENVLHVDSSFFDVFSSSFLYGDIKTALSRPNAIILSSSTANKYFGDADPVGKIIQVDDWTPCVVTGVIRDWPEQSHFKFDMLVPLIRFLDDRAGTNWTWQAFYTYIKLNKNADEKLIGQKINSLAVEADPANKNKYSLQALEDIHLTSDRIKELQPNSDKSYLVIFGTVALFILLIACLNYVSLATGNASLRAKEIGIRKVNGAEKKTLAGHFLAEAICTSLLAGMLAILLLWLTLPAFNITTEKNIRLTGNEYLLMYGGVIIAAVLIGAIAGLYPAFYLSSLDTIKILKGQNQLGSDSLPVRKILTVTQFAIVTLLIIGTLGISRQVDYIQHARLGLNKDNILLVNVNTYVTPDEISSIKNEWLKAGGVKSVAAADGAVLDRSWPREVKYPKASSGQMVDFLSVDSDYIKVMNIRLKSGRNFSSGDISDTVQNILLNETAVMQLGIPDPVIGQRVIWRTNPLTHQSYYANILGVMKDFHFSSMKKAITPFALVNTDKRKWMYTIKIDGAGTAETVDRIKAVWDKNVHSRSFQYSFLDERFGRLYSSEIHFKNLFTYTTFIAIFLSCLGLFGLSVFLIQNRSKEMSIRRVFGASAYNISTLLLREFLQLVLISAVIAIPVAAWGIHVWLEQYAYRISVGGWIFLAGGSITMLIALFTISIQTIKASFSNPVKSLRGE
jgi:putative ABC transport system permease protein